MLSSRVAILGLCVGCVTLSAWGCGDDNAASSPVSPTVIDQPQAQATLGASLRDVQTALDVNVIGQSDATLKVGPPTPTAPANGQTGITCTTEQCNNDRAAREKDGLENPTTVTPTLTVTNPVIEWAEGQTFSYAFAVYKGAAGTELIETALVEGGSGSTSHLAIEPLEANQQYSWKARAYLTDTESNTNYYGEWSSLFTFTIEAAPEPPKPVVVIGTPTPTFPINNETITDFTPHLSVNNGTNEGTAADIGQIIYEIQLATSPSASTVLVTASTHARTGSTRIALRPTGQAFETELSASTTYYWRARGKNDGVKTHFRPDNSLVVVDPSDWTEWQVFKTADASETGANAPYNCCPPPNRLSVVQQVAAEIGYPGSGVDVRELTQKVAEKLYAEDNRWGRRINDTGPLGKDTVAYKVDGSNDNPYSVDIVSGAEGSDPKIHWDGHGQIGGTWQAP